MMTMDEARGDLGLSPYIQREQMPQGGWTETVAAGRVDLTATVEHVYELALLPEAKPAYLNPMTMVGHVLRHSDYQLRNRAFRGFRVP